MFEHIETIIGAVAVNVLTTLLNGIITGIIPTPGQAVSHKRKNYVLFVALSLLISSGVAIWIARSIEAPQKARPVFSDFNLCTPVNNYGARWEAFNDNPYNGDTNVGVKATKSPANSDDCYGLITFNLGPTSSIDPYAGIFSGFSLRPSTARDVSHFSGIRLNIWHEGSFPEGVRVRLHLAPAQMSDWYDGYFAYDVTEYAKKQQPSPEVFVPFEMFVASPPLLASGFQGGFGKPYQGQLYLVAIVIQGEKGVASKGNVAVDNIAFY
jgi:hypothetical protein